MIVDLKQAQIPSRVELLMSRIYILMCSSVPIVNDIIYLVKCIYKFFNKGCKKMLIRQH